MTPLGPTGRPAGWTWARNDIPKAIGFYSSQFGWEIEPGGPEMGGYSMARLGGRNVAGIGPIMGPPGTPSAWTTYFASADADATAARITNAGGQILSAPMDVMDAGPAAGRGRRRRRGLRRLAGPQAHRHRARQRARRVHLERAHEPRLRGRQGVLRGRLRLRVRRHVERRVQLRHHAHQRPAGRRRHRRVPARPGGRPPRRLVGLLRHLRHRQGGRTATGHGGRVVRPAADSPYGRMAVVADADGAVFSLISTPADDE